jgi:hypothetical protein
MQQTWELDGVAESRLVPIIRAIQADALRWAADEVAQKGQRLHGLYLKLHAKADALAAPERKEEKAC